MGHGAHDPAKGDRNRETDPYLGLFAKKGSFGARDEDLLGRS